MRAFAGGYYNNLKALYDYLGVQYRSQPFLFDFSTSDSASAGRTGTGTGTGTGSHNASYFVHASNLHQLAPRPSTVGLGRYMVDVIYLIACYTWFSICCFLVAPARGETVQQYLHRTKMPRRFTTYYLVPLISSVTTCPHKSLLAFPATDLTEYKRRTHGAPHYTVSEGVRRVQERLIQGVDSAMNTTVTAVEPSEKGVMVSWTQTCGSQCQMHTELFDSVVLAVAPDVVGHVWEPLRHHMSRIPTAIVESVVHDDAKVLGQENGKVVRNHAGGAQLIHLHTSNEHDFQTESHHIQPCGAIVTTCPFSAIEPAKVIHSAKFTRVLRSVESQRIVNAIFEGTLESGDDKSIPLWRNGDDNVWLAGGWCWDGMVLLEGCVRSAMRIADAFGVDVPWRSRHAAY
jgi:predicted NAD/FAD-binding protein